MHPSGESEKEKQALERGKVIKLQPGKSEDTNKNDDKNSSASKDSTAGGEFLTIGATKKASRVTSGFFDRCDMLKLQYLLSDLFSSITF